MIVAQLGSPSAVPRQVLAMALEASKSVLHFQRWTIAYVDERCVPLDRRQHSRAFMPSNSQ